jgi:hypothetical protein
MASARAARVAEAAAAEMASLNREHARMAKARERERARIMKAGGRAALELLQVECGQERCCWVMSEDPPAVCGRKNASTWDVYCRKHNRQLDAEQAAKRAASEYPG